jgi:hypothetical protein
VELISGELRKNTYRHVAPRLKRRPIVKSCLRLLTPGYNNDILFIVYMAVPMMGRSIPCIFLSREGSLGWKLPKERGRRSPLSE